MTVPIRTFMLIAYGMSFGIAATIVFTGGEESAYAGLAFLVMFAPTIAALVSRAIHRDGQPGERWRAFSVNYAALGMVATPLVWGLSFCVGLVLFGPGLQWASWLGAGADGLIHPPALFGGDPFPVEQLTTKLLTKLLVLLLPLALLTLGEEYGWRSFLQRRLEQRLGPRRAILWTAVIWAYFHLGFFLADAGDVEPWVHWVGALLVAPAGLVAVGVFFGWLYHRSGSLWVVVFAHAANNKWGQIPKTYLEQADDELPVMMVATLLLALAGFAFYRWMPVDQAAPAAVESTSASSE